ncbi:MAG: hypothetical protein GY797_23775 [Deltaproteobacteria bacterium]|nr:hypothetical protein [Deltaproteobacteria bacterium]
MATTIMIRKASFSTRKINNLEPNWQLIWKIIMFNEGFETSMPSLPLTLNVEH